MAPLTGKKVLAIALVSFGIVFAVNGYMAAKAIETYTGEDADDAYVQGANYNLTLERRAKQAALGWRATISVTRENTGAARILVRIDTRDGRPVDTLTLTGVMRHPSNANRDRVLTLTSMRGGVYAATVANVEAGSWDVTVDAGRNDEPFEAMRSIWLH